MKTKQQSDRTTAPQRREDARPREHGLCQAECEEGALARRVCCDPARERQGGLRAGSGPQIVIFGAPKGNRTPVSAVKGRRPGPLDDGRVWRGLIGGAPRPHKQPCSEPAVLREAVRSGETDKRPSHHFPVFCMDFHGSAGASAGPFCSSSIEMLSGERTKAMLPSRGGRLMVTPAFCNLAHVS